MSRRLTILIVPLESQGQLNFCHGIADVLRDRGHRIVFAIEKSYTGKLVQYGFEEEVKVDEPSGQQMNDEFFIEFVKKNAESLKSTPLVAAANLVLDGFTIMHSKNMAFDETYQNIIKKIKPDIILIDMYCGSPTLTNAGIPWVRLFSAAPHMILNSDQIPPYWSGMITINLLDKKILTLILLLGLPLNDKTGWNDFIEKRDDLTAKLRNDINQFYVSKGLPELPNKRLHPESPYLNIYLFPKELDYTELIPNPKNYIGIDAAVRATNEQFSIPEQLQSKRGKLVFLTIGSFISADIELMNRLVNILSKSPNRFIVSKGKAHDKYELADNMWGQKSVPQIKILPLVDLVIHHGGNNSLTETFYFGKPMIIMPLFGDQFDIAQRVVEVGCGLRLNPYHCSEQELLDSIEQILNNGQLIEKMRLIGERIRASDSLERVADRIENIVN